MYQFKTEIRNLNRYSQLGRIIYNGPANTYYNGQNLKVALYKICGRKLPDFSPER